MEDEDREDLDAAVVAMGVSLRCTASSWETERHPLEPSYGLAGFNQCIHATAHLGDHQDEYGQVFRLAREGYATIVRRDETIKPTQKQIMDGWFDGIKTRVEMEKREAEEQRLRGTRFSETREYPGMAGFPLTQLQDPTEPDSPTQRLARIVGLHWTSDDGICVECENSYPCETVRIAMALS